MLPLIKWTGAKRFQAPYIVDKIPNAINTYFEPFLGSGAVLTEYLFSLESGKKKCNHIVCSDVNEDLIEIWKLVKSNYTLLLDEYRKLYEGFKNVEYDHKLKKEYYYNIRKEYNDLKKENSKDKRRYIIFYWLTRTCFNGLIRYNKYGEFNSPCHFSRNGIIPEKLEKIFNEYNILLNKYNVQFVCCSYDDIPFPLNTFQKDDFIYCDPPYITEGSLYEMNKINYNDFFEWLKTISCKYVLSFDGLSGNDDNTYKEMEAEIYDKIEYINSGLSSFKRITKKKLDQVYDCLYIKEAKV